MDLGNEEDKAMLT